MVFVWDCPYWIEAVQTRNDWCFLVTLAYLVAPLGISSCRWFQTSNRLISLVDTLSDSRTVLLILILLICVHFVSLGRQLSFTRYHAHLRFEFKKSSNRLNHWFDTKRRIGVLFSIVSWVRNIWFLAGKRSSCVGQVHFKSRRDCVYCSYSRPSERLVFCWKIKRLSKKIKLFASCLPPPLQYSSRKRTWSLVSHAAAWPRFPRKDRFAAIVEHEDFEPSW